MTDVWIAPEEIVALRGELGLTVEQAAARVAASVTAARRSPRAIAEMLSNIESGRDCVVPGDISSAIRRGLGMRTIERSVVLQSRYLVTALQRAGLAEDEALDRIWRIARDDAHAAKIAHNALHHAIELESQRPEAAAPCGPGKAAWSAVDQHREMKHRGIARADCTKCATLILKAEDHVATCSACMANAEWLEYRSAVRLALTIPISAARVLSLLVGVPMRSLSAATSHQRRQLYGVASA